MQGRDFLDLAREVVSGGTEKHWRGAAIHAYYALVLECRDALLRWGVRIPPRDNMHTFVRLRSVYATDPDLNRIGYRLDDLGKLRNQASYNLATLPAFANEIKANEAIQEAEERLTDLDAIEAYPVRRAAAIASLPP
jgi:hypothetical protein